MPRLPRFEHVDGIGRLRVYDAGQRFADRYTVLFEDMASPETRVVDGQIVSLPLRNYGPRQALALSDNPSHPQGFSQWTSAVVPQTYGRGADHRRIAFSDLPEKVQKHVIWRATEE